MEPSGGFILAKASGPVISQYASKGMDRLVSRVRGKRILLLGPPGSGKSSVFNYMQTGSLDVEDVHVKTVDAEHSAHPFKLKVGEGAEITLRIRRITDIPGQYGATQHANLVREHEPHVLVIVLDCTQSVKSLRQWVSEFCERLAELLAESDNLKGRLSSITFLLNKCDRIPGASSHNRHTNQRSNSKIDRIRETVNREVTTELKPVYGGKSTGRFSVRKSIAVENEDGDRLLKAVIKKIATELATRRGS